MTDALPAPSDEAPALLVEPSTPPAAPAPPPPVILPQHRRADGSLVVLLDGLPYHVTAEDPLREAAEAAAAGLDLPGEPPAPVLAPQPPPDSATLWQVRAELLARGLFDAVDAAMRDAVTAAQAAGDPAALLAAREAAQAWEYANTVSRGGALVRAMAAQLGFQESDLDGFFAAAASREA